MTTKLKLNYDFNIRNIDATKEKHTYQINKLKKVYKDDINEIFNRLEYNLSFELQSSGFNYQHRYENFALNSFRQDKTQRNLKALKSIVNNITRNYITSQLGYYEIPKSYDTAFYCIYYNKINKLMKRELKEYLRNYA